MRNLTIILEWFGNDSVFAVDGCAHRDHVDNAVDQRDDEKYRSLGKMRQLCQHGRGY